MRLMRLLVLFFIQFLPADAKPQVDNLFLDQLNFWQSFRDNQTGLYCDSLYFEDDIPCGESNDRYSSASTGMGLIIDAISVELGLLNITQGEARAKQTLESLLSNWPKESFHGFYVHWTNREYDILGEFSTIDSALLALGSLFAGNYYSNVLGTDDIENRAIILSQDIQWSDSIEAFNEPVIYPEVNASTGEMMGIIRPFNEYYLVAYLAKMFESRDQGKASRFFETYFGNTNKPQGDGTYPIDMTYLEYPLLTDNTITFMSSFIPQFCWYQSKGFHSNPYYLDQLYPNWALADMSYWNNTIHNATSENQYNEIWGIDVSEHLFFGCGAGDSPTGYSVNRIGMSEDYVFSAAIMAGFLPGLLNIGQKDQSIGLGETVLNDLTWLYENLPYKTGLGYDVIWRYSYNQSDWQATLADSIDYVTLVLGLSTQYLPNDFFETYAA